MAQQRILSLTVPFLLLAFIARACAEDDCSGPVVEVRWTDQARQTFVYGALASHGSLTGFKPMTNVPLMVARPLDACGELSEQRLAGAIVLAQRGNCSFADKTYAVQRALGLGILVFNNESGCVTMGFDLENATVKMLTIPAISLPQSVGQRFYSQAVSKEVIISLNLIYLSGLDASSIVLWFMAVGTVVGGSLWAGHDYMSSKQQGSDAVSQPPQVAGNDVVVVTTKQSIAFVFMASAMLLAFFFFLNDVFFYVLLVMFCLAGSQALTAILMAVKYALVPRWKAQLWQVPLWGELQSDSAALFCVSAAVAVVFALWRTAFWSWALQDLLGIALMLLVLRTLRLSSLKVACVLLPLCFVYDVFWVFIQPLLFGGGRSVMVEVAQGGSSNEFIPMLLRVPRLWHTALGGYSMLGFGDIILPGLLVAYARRSDLDMHASLARGLFGPVVVAYGGGLVLTYVALVLQWGGSQGQPALLYVVPCTLGTLLAVAGARGRLQAMWADHNGSGAAMGGKWAVLDGGGDDHDSDPGGGVPEDVDVEAMGGAASRNSALSERTRLLRPASSADLV